LYKTAKRVAACINFLKFTSVQTKSKYCFTIKTLPLITDTSKLNPLYYLVKQSI